MNVFTFSKLYSPKPHEIRTLHSSRPFQVRTPTAVNWTLLPSTYSSHRAGGPEEEGDFPVDASTARSRIRGRFKNNNNPPLEDINDLPCQPASRRWQNLQDDINIRLVEDRNHTALVLTHLQGELYQQRPILLRSLLGGSWCQVRLQEVGAKLGYRKLVPS